MDKKKKNVKIFVAENVAVVEKQNNENTEESVVDEA
jgi:hypothetical protein